MRIAYTEEQFQRYSDSQLPFALPVDDSPMFVDDSTPWLVTLLHGNEAFPGWYAGLTMARLRVICGRERYQDKVQESQWFIATIENEIDYRLHGELLPSGD